MRVSITDARLSYDKSVYLHVYRSVLYVVVFCLNRFFRYMVYLESNRHYIIKREHLHTGYEIQGIQKCAFCYKYRRVSLKRYVTDSHYCGSVTGSQMLGRTANTFDELGDPRSVNFGVDLPTYARTG